MVLNFSRRLWQDNFAAYAEIFIRLMTESHRPNLQEQLTELSRSSNLSATSASIATLLQKTSNSRGRAVFSSDKSQRPLNRSIRCASSCKNAKVLTKVCFFAIYDNQWHLVERYRIPHHLFWKTASILRQHLHPIVTT